MSSGPKRVMKYRTGINSKNLKQFRARVTGEVHDFFEINSYDENGMKRSKGKILEMLVAKVISAGNPRSH